MSATAVHSHTQFKDLTAHLWTTAQTSSITEWAKEKPHLKVAQLVKCLSCRYKAPSLVPTVYAKRPGVEAETGGALRPAGQAA